MYAFGEIPIIHRINPENLETESRVDVSDFVSIVHHTSHPHVMNDGNSLFLHIVMKVALFYTKNRSESGTFLHEKS
jgi:hypothetical protein